MPVYEFECPDCDILFEERLSPAQLDEVVVGGTPIQPALKQIPASRVPQRPLNLERLRLRRHPASVTRSAAHAAGILGRIGVHPAGF